MEITGDPQGSLPQLAPLGPPPRLNVDGGAVPPSQTTIPTAHHQSPLEIDLQVSKGKNLKWFNVYGDILKHLKLFLATLPSSPNYQRAVRAATINNKWAGVMMGPLFNSK